MRLGKIIGKAAGAFAAVALVGLSACDGVDVRVNEGDGVPLSELDMSGDAPEGIVLAGPDTVVITTGEDFSVDVEGSQEAQDNMRFSLEDGTFAVMREGDWSVGDGATINVTMPPPNTIVIAGSGSLTTDGLSSDADVTIAGTGSATATGVAADSLDVTIAGSGTLTASGTVGTLDLNVLGSGNANMADLQVDNADVTIAGSGSAEFASDGAVEAQVMGSGTVRVSGSANCSVESMGSGTLVCDSGE
ncbi:head GIN domain-containing protein [Aurantiacibacter gilvus]|uniref:Head GIN domain-containing protein n=1 Tax=Aurantiacibacter gilvus TaxID=3139141 RepID=A0ABU9IH73_9SPHN